MINKEAIEQLKLNLKGECLYSSEPIEIAIKALEKQVPRKIKLAEDEDGFAITRCAVCSIYLGQMDNYCPNCGQKIDWSEE